MGCVNSESELYGAYHIIIKIIINSNNIRDVVRHVYVGVLNRYTTAYPFDLHACTADGVPLS